MNEQNVNVVENNGEVKVGFIKRGVKFLGNHKIAAGTICAALIGGGLYWFLSNNGEEATDKVAESIEKTVESVTDAISK